MTAFAAGALRSPALYLSAMLVGAIVYFSVANPFFGDWENVRTVAAGSAPLGVIALGVTLALACGAIDFSVAATAALAAVVMGWVGQHAAIGLGVPAALGVGVAVGLANGLVITRFRLDAFITTLAAAGAYRGLAFLVAGSSVGVSVESDLVTSLGQDMALGVPNTVWTLAIVALVAWWVLRFTPFGRRLLAVGGNREAARLAGVSPSRVQIAGYVISGTCAALGGILLAGRAETAIPQAATGTELLVFSAVLLGGTSLFGGRASVIGSLLAVLFLNFLYNGLVLERISSYWQTIIQGALLIVAVWLLRLQSEGRDPAALVAAIGRRVRRDSG